MQVSADKYYNGTTQTVDYLATVQPDGYLYFNDDTFYRCREDGTQLQQCYMSKNQWVRCGILSNISLAEFTTGVPGGSVQAIISLAQSQLGNDGAKYWNWYFGGGYVNGSVTQYCACFVSWLLDQVGATAYSFPRANAFDASDTPSQYRIPERQLIAGDIVSFDWGGDSGGDHVGLVIGNNGSYITTIEGNTDGGLVKQKERYYNQFILFGIRPTYAS